uniref:Uncharacterized protein n=1 Tax=Rhizophora mucronata TaxID=61149 RepID=A0A2P2LTC8_RHIMU
MDPRKKRNVRTYQDNGILNVNAVVI